MKVDKIIEHFLDNLNNPIRFPNKKGEFHYIKYIQENTLTLKIVFNYYDNRPKINLIIRECSDIANSKNIEELKESSLQELIHYSIFGKGGKYYLANGTEVIFYTIKELLEL